jgi:hypothetical protein
MKEKSIKIYGLTTEQIDMLDIIWSLETSEDHINWLENLDDDEQRMAMSLTILLALEVIDNAMPEDLKVSKSYLKRFQLK